MKSKLILLSAYIFSIEFVQAQIFQGEIVYNNKYTSKMKNLTDEMLNVMMGTKQEYFIKGGNYKSFLNGLSIIMQLYDYKTNRIYSRTAKSDTLYWFDASINTDTVTSFEIKKN